MKETGPNLPYLPPERDRCVSLFPVPFAAFVLLLGATTARAQDAFEKEFRAFATRIA